MPDRQCGPLNVLKRNRLGSYVHFECPTCRQTVALGPASLMEIEAGNHVLSWCHRCLSNTAVSLVSLGGFLWFRE
jgi:ssDNA-binding Zn-finger/Zn-ribbon topoisomerase 1